MAKRDEYRTVNADLAAALWAAGIEPVLETVDGITVEFVFPQIADDYEGQSLLVAHLAADWSEGALNVDARMLSQRSRQLRTKMRKTCEEFIRERRSALRKKV
jgi:hypothetical protein